MGLEILIYNGNDREKVIVIGKCIDVGIRYFRGRKTKVGGGSGDQSFLSGMDGCVW